MLQSKGETWSQTPAVSGGGLIAGTLLAYRYTQTHRLTDTNTRSNGDTGTQLYSQTVIRTNRHTRTCGHMDFRTQTYGHTDTRLYGHTVLRSYRNMVLQTHGHMDTDIWTMDTQTQKLSQTPAMEDLLL